MILNPPTYTDVRLTVGEPGGAPYDIQLRRQSTAEVMQRMGAPVLVKRHYSIEDVEKGEAVESPTMDDIYQQSTYATDELSHGVGFVSAETQAGEWYDPATGKLYDSKDAPSFLPAPKHRGYGPGYLTYVILPDRPEDTWKLTEQGALIRQQQAMVQLPWWPTVGDNDLVIPVEVDALGRIIEAYERYQLRMVSPLTMRGNNPIAFRSDYGGHRESGILPVASGNRWWVGQQAELVHVPPTDQIYNVEVDR